MNWLAISIISLCCSGLVVVALLALIAWSSVDLEDERELPEADLLNRFEGDWFEEHMRVESIDVDPASGDGNGARQ